jgi:hypothetical protein
MKNNRFHDLIGSPYCYPSSGKQERAAQFGLNYENEESFEGNQSFPRTIQTHSKFKQNDFIASNKIKGFLK